MTGDEATARREAVARLAHPCIYCLRSEGSSDTEHVVPAGLGPHVDIVLPAGAVCTHCNNWLGRNVDEGLVHLFEVELIRGVFQVPDRHGKVRAELPLRNGHIRFTESEFLNVAIRGSGHVRETASGTVKATLRARRSGSGQQWRQVARSVLKAGLGVLYLRKGPDEVLHARYDGARRAILGAAYEGYLLIGKFDPRRWPDLEVSLLFDRPGMDTAVRVRYGGLDLIADVTLGRPSQEVHTWSREHGYEVMEINPRLARRMLRLATRSRQ